MPMLLYDEAHYALSESMGLTYRQRLAFLEAQGVPSFQPLPDRWQRLVQPPSSLSNEADLWLARKARSLRPLGSWALVLAITRVCRAWIDEPLVARLGLTSVLEVLDWGMTMLERGVAYASVWQRWIGLLPPLPDNSTENRAVLTVKLNAALAIHPVVPWAPRPAQALSLGYEFSTADPADPNNAEHRRRFGCLVREEFERILCVDNALESDWAEDLTDDTSL